MAKCECCGTTILFGGVADNGYRFCNEKCHQRGLLAAVTNHVPDGVIAQQITEVHGGTCPKCGGVGPVDVHTSYIAWSALIVTSWQSRPQVCCRSCGIKAKLGAAAICGLVGWWGIPWGLLVTPVQILRNLFGIFWCPDPATPSEQLKKFLRLELAARLVQANHAVPAVPTPPLLPVQPEAH